MALTVSYTDEFGTTHDNAYVRIIDAHFNYESVPTLSVTVGVYVNQTARQTFRKRWLHNFEASGDEFDFENTADIRGDIYAWLKQRTPDPEQLDLRNAVDV